MQITMYRPLPVPNPDPTAAAIQWTDGTTTPRYKPTLGRKGKNFTISTPKQETIQIFATGDRIINSADGKFLEHYIAEQRLVKKPNGCSTPQWIFEQIHTELIQVRNHKYKFKCSGCSATKAPLIYSSENNMHHYIRLRKRDAGTWACGDAYLGDKLVRFKLCAKCKQKCQPEILETSSDEIIFTGRIEEFFS